MYWQSGHQRVWHQIRIRMESDWNQRRHSETTSAPFGRRRVSPSNSPNGKNWFQIRHSMTELVDSNGDRMWMETDSLLSSHWFPNRKMFGINPMERNHQISRQNLGQNLRTNWAKIKNTNRSTIRISGATEQQKVQRNTESQWNRYFVPFSECKFRAKSKYLKFDEFYKNPNRLIFREEITWNHWLTDGLSVHRKWESFRRLFFGDKSESKLTEKWESHKSLYSDRRLHGITKVLSAPRGALTDFKLKSKSKSKWIQRINYMESQSVWYLMIQWIYSVKQ